MVRAGFLTNKFLAGSIANKNAIPCAPRPPRVTSGGGAAETDRVATRALANMGDAVAAQARAFPAPGVDD